MMPMRIPAARAASWAAASWPSASHCSQAWNRAWLASRARSAATSAEPTARSGSGQVRQSGPWISASAHHRPQSSSGCPSRRR